MSFLRDVLTKRFITRVKKNYPSLFFCIFLILGQFIAFNLIGYKSSYFIIILTIILFFCSFIKKYYFISFFIIGMFSFYINNGNLNFNTYNDESSYLIKIVSNIQNKVSNRVTFDAKVLGVWEEKRKSFKELSFKKQSFLMHCSALYLPWKNIVNANKGDVLIIKGKVKNVDFSYNPFSYESYLLRKNISKTCKVKFVKVIEHKNIKSYANIINKKIKDHVIEVLGDNESSGLFLSTTIGTRNVLSSSVEDKFKKVGLTHLLVVSGYQVCLVYFTIIFLLKFITKFFVKLYYYFFLQYVYKFIALSFSIFYVLISGCDSSSIRAGIAIIIINIASTFEKGNSFLNSIFLSFFIMHLLFPLCLLAPGVALSYGALLGIWLGSFEKNKIKCFLLISFYTYITTSIITLIWFKQISFISFLLNITIAPLISWISCNLGFLGIFLNFTIDKSGIFIKLVSYILDEFKSFVINVSYLNYISHVFEVTPIALILLMLFFIFMIIIKRIKYYIAFWNL